MSFTSTERDTFRRLDEAVSRLGKASDGLLELMDHQIEAVASSNPEQVEFLADEHARHMHEYEELKHGFMTALRQAIPAAVAERQGVTLEALKTVEPVREEQIDEWRQKLSYQVRTLQTRQKQVRELLEFALLQNARIMHSIYQMENGSDVRYKADGEASGSVSGVAVNREV